MVIKLGNKIPQYKQSQYEVENKSKRKPKSQSQLQRNQRLNLDPRQGRYLTHHQSMCKYIAKGVVVSDEDQGLSNPLVVLEGMDDLDC